MRKCNNCGRNIVDNPKLQAMQIEQSELECSQRQECGQRGEVLRCSECHFAEFVEAYESTDLQVLRENDPTVN